MLFRLRARHGVEDHRLRHGRLPGRPAEHREEPARGRGTGWRGAARALLARDLAQPAPHHRVRRHDQPDHAPSGPRQGGPIRSTTLFVYAIYEEVFQNLRVGRASALVVVFFLVLSVLTVLNLWAFRASRGVRA